MSASHVNMSGSYVNICQLSERLSYVSICQLREHVYQSCEHVCQLYEHVYQLFEHVCQLCENVCQLCEHVCQWLSHRRALPRESDYSSSNKDKTHDICIELSSAVGGVWGEI